MKKGRLMDICNKLKPPNNDQASLHNDQKHSVPVKPTMSSSHANGTTDVTQQPIQVNGEGNRTPNPIDQHSTPRPTINKTAPMIPVTQRKTWCSSPRKAPIYSRCGIEAHQIPSP